MDGHLPRPDVGISYRQHLLPDHLADDADTVDRVEGEELETLSFRIIKNASLEMHFLFGSDVVIGAYCSPKRRRNTGSRESAKRSEPRSVRCSASTVCSLSVPVRPSAGR